MAFFAVGCAAAPGPEPVPEENFPAPNPSPQPSPTPDSGLFLIGPGNVLDITVLGEPELSLPVRVTEAGMISFPLLGQVEVSGLTPMQLERHLEELLGRDYLVAPRVTIYVQEYGKISVLGQVKKPGAYGYREQLTVTGAIALGGGMTEIADPNKTQVIRTRGGIKQVFRVRIDDVLEDGEEEADLTLKPGDIVFVPESFF